MKYSMENLCDSLIIEIESLVDKQQLELWDDLVDKINLDWDAYRQMEDAGVFYLFTVRDGDQLIGYCSFIVSQDPHYKGRLVALQDSIFVLKEYRSKGVGNDLIDYCDDILEKGFKVKSIQHNVNIKIDFSPLLERKGYKPTEKVLIKRFE